jgi:hypothetical protein
MHLRLRLRRNISRVQTINSKQIIKRVTRGLTVRRGVDGRAGGAVCGDFEFVFGCFVAVPSLASSSSGLYWQGGWGKGGYSSWSSSTRRSAWDFPVVKGLVLGLGLVD